MLKLSKFYPCYNILSSCKSPLRYPRTAYPSSFKDLINPRILLAEVASWIVNSLVSATDHSEVQDFYKLSVCLSVCMCMHVCTCMCVRGRWGRKGEKIITSTPAMLATQDSTGYEQSERHKQWAWGWRPPGWLSSLLRKDTPCHMFFPVSERSLGCYPCWALLLFSPGDLATQLTEEQKDGAHHIPFSSVYLCYHSPLKCIWSCRLQDAMWVRTSQVYPSVSQVQVGRRSKDGQEWPLRELALMAVLICVFHSQKKKSGTWTTDDFFELGNRSSWIKKTWLPRI